VPVRSPVSYIQRPYQDDGVPVRDNDLQTGLHIFNRPLFHPARKYFLKGKAVDKVEIMNLYLAQKRIGTIDQPQPVIQKKHEFLGIFQQQVEIFFLFGLDRKSVV
jgi:hypothetical protein